MKTFSRLKWRGSARALLLILAALGLASTGVLAAETNVLVRDPSTIIQRGDTYWIYGTGEGVQQFSSTDRLHWTKRGSVLRKMPDWLKEAVPSKRGNGAWAPDVSQWNGKYYLYYSYSMLHSKESGIGVATSETLEPSRWVDQGAVIVSGAKTDYNAIDPSILRQENGRIWMVFGSYFSGIKLLELDPATGKRLAPESPIHTLANRGAPGNAVEAPYIYFHDGYYYLFVNWDSCCAGIRSTYHIRIGRSKNVTGPYLDKNGRDMREGGGTLFITSTFDNGSGRPVDDQIGPGHAGVLRDRDGYWLSTHYEWARDKKGATTMNINKLDWDADGWPRLVLDAGPYELVSSIATHGLATAVPDTNGNGALPQTWYVQGTDRQRWKLDYQGDGCYQIVSLESGKALGTVEDAPQPGAKITFLSPARRDAQLWLPRQNEDGTYTLLLKSGGQSSALDVGGCSPNDGAAIGLWVVNGLDCQKWSLRPR